VNDFMNQIGDFVLPPASVLTNAADPTGGTLCQVQSWLESFFELSSPMWTTAIAATLYMSVIMRRSGEQVESSFPWMVGVCVGVPLVLTVIPGALGYYGVAGAWCWIADAHASWRLWQFFLPLLLCIAFNAYAYVRVICAIRATVRATEESAGGVADAASAQMRVIVGRLSRYPLILVVVWFFAAVNRASEAATGQSAFALYLLQKLFSSSQGFLNALAYGFSSGVQEAVTNDVAALCPCVRDRVDREILASPASAPRGFRGGGGGGKGGSGGESRLERDLGSTAEDADADDVTDEYGVEVAVREQAPALELGSPAVTANPAAGRQARPMADRVRGMSSDSGVV